MTTGVATPSMASTASSGRPCPRQLRPDQRAAQPFEKNVLGAITTTAGYVSSSSSATQVPTFRSGPAAGPVIDLHEVEKYVVIRIYKMQFQAASI